MNTFLLIDANSLIHRSYHALPPFTNTEGQPTGALYGLANILLKILREEPPQFIAAFFDRPEPTFRKKIFEEYKIHRPPTPNSLVSQIQEARNLFQKLGIKTFEALGFEADDLIGTAVQKFKKTPDLKIMILTGDLDTLQLVENDRIVVKIFKRGVTETMIYNESAVKKRYGIAPEKLPDYKGLIGDSSDNIPGVLGVGPKTAAQIIQKYGTLQNFFSEGQKDKNYGKIAGAKEQFLLSRRLGEIVKDAPLQIQSIDDLTLAGPKEQDLILYLKKLGFKSLVKRVENQQNKLF